MLYNLKFHGKTWEIISIRFGHRFDYEISYLPVLMLFLVIFSIFGGKSQDQDQIL